MPRTLYLVLSGAPAPEGMIELIQAFHGHDWHVTVLSTPTGTDFHDQDQLADLTGGPVRVAFRMPGQGKPLPPADVVLACPLTFNSTNKFAQGLADNFAIALLCEMVGYGVPTVVVPHCKPQLATHPAFTRSLQTLHGMEPVTVLHNPDAPTRTICPPGSRSSTLSTASDERHSVDLAARGQTIKRARRRHGYSQSVLAGLVGRSESWLSHVERGERVGASTVVAVYRALTLV